MDSESDPLESLFRADALAADAQIQKVDPLGRISTGAGGAPATRSVAQASRNVAVSARKTSGLSHSAAETALFCATFEELARRRQVLPIAHTSERSLPGRGLLGLVCLLLHVPRFLAAGWGRRTSTCSRVPGVSWSRCHPIE